MSVSEVAAMNSVNDPLLKSGAYSSGGSPGYSGTCPACPAPGSDPGWTASGAPERSPSRTYAPQRPQNSSPGEMACPLSQVHTGPRSRSPLSITRPASVPILGHFSPARRLVDQGVIRSRPGLASRHGTLTPPARAARGLVLPGVLGHADLPQCGVGPGAGDNRVRILAAQPREPLRQELQVHGHGELGEQRGEAAI